MGRIAEANRELVVRNLTQPGDTERDVADASRSPPSSCCRWSTRPSSTPSRRNLLEQIKRDVIGAADLDSGELGGAVEPHHLLRRPGRVHPPRRGDRPRGAGLVAGRLEEMATAVAEPPVRLVKTIGDAVMLVSPEAERDGRRGPRP